MRLVRFILYNDGYGCDDEVCGNIDAKKGENWSKDIGFDCALRNCFIFKFYFVSGLDMAKFCETK